MLASSAASLLDARASSLEEWRDGPGKKLSIVKSSSAVVSLAASFLLVRILFRSRKRMGTTYHRLLLGMSITDIVYSLSFVTFGAITPRELGYVVWNARGSRASCDAFGFISSLGGYGSLMYSCALNIYYLAQIKYNKTDYYIVKKVEPWLHAVPILFGLILSTVFVSLQLMNSAIDGTCGAYIYTPPHCNGHGEGEIPEGFEMPCERGRNLEALYYVVGLVTLFAVPITIGTSLWTIYRSVLETEQRSERYGAGALNRSLLQPPQRTSNNAADAEEGGEGGKGLFSIVSAVKGRFRGRAEGGNSGNRDTSQSRAVLQRAVAYSVSYFLTWIWLIIFAILNLAGAFLNDFPPRQKWVIAVGYVWCFFQPLQGLWTLLVYIQPNVIKRKRSSEGNISWLNAFSGALRSAVSGGNNAANSTGRGRRRESPGAPGTAAAHVGPRTNATTNARATAGSSNRRGNLARAESAGLDAEGAEEVSSSLRSLV